MGQVEDLRLFVLVVENSSISKAADKLRIAKSAVSRRLNLLEERYGTRLIDRAPGVWALTETGRELFQRAVRIVGDVEEIDGDFANAPRNLAGPLSVSVPREFGLAFLNPTLIAFKQRHPEIKLTIDFDDRKVDLARENYDFAIRIASGKEIDASATKIGRMQHLLVGSSEYLEVNSEPTSLEDLRQHKLLYFGNARRASWDFITENGKPIIFECQPFLNSNSGVFLLEAVRKGMGIGRLPDFVAAGALSTGDLVTVLPDLGVPEWGIFLVHAEDRRLNLRMRLFAEEIGKALGEGTL
ncbi:LysR family transcriptional regulator [Mesorhizobium kowhaii]|uniref:LysR family transcriptional regulator n=1 Tax=Mesorhizobium kowhaii TaxID=1300272 RepID=A0A2W7C6H4_9HYPH|nr:LysR family transcriptional regulator [Mesorhizobium kowhaii]PZV38762.1 LysR family transcriptional regulator [Mesorhizobium kowhaii]